MQSFRKVNRHFPFHVAQLRRRAGVNLEMLQISVLTPFPATPLMDEFRPHLVFGPFRGDCDFFDGPHRVYGHGRLGITEVQQAALDAHGGLRDLGG